jgi:hypothetical protein
MDLLKRGHAFFFSDKFKERFESWAIYLGILGFIAHLLLIGLFKWGLLPFTPSSTDLFRSPLSAIYTPFSFILIYEVYLLVYYLPRSFTESIQKQYEIILLILVRKLFKDLAHVDLEHNWWTEKYNVWLMIDMGGFVILFLLFWIFRRWADRKPEVKGSWDIDKFVEVKRFLSVALLLILVGLGVYSLGGWLKELYDFNKGVISELTDINTVFYDEFFTLLILVDVALLMVSFKYTERFSQLIRNSGFVVSTVLIRMSFVVEGPENTILILGGVLFGTLIQILYVKLCRLELEETPG